MRHPALNIDIETPISELDWDCMEDMPLEVTAGTIHDLTSSVASWQISSLNGAKLTPGSVSSGQLGSGAVASGHIQAEAVTADAIAGNSVTANKLESGTVTTYILDAVTAHIESITAQSITTDTLTAAFASLLTLVAGDIEADSITTDQLAAVIANIISVHARTGDFDLATITNLVSSALTLQHGQADSMYITNLAVTSANLLNATIGRLILKGDDGKYYEVSVGSDGVIQTAEVALTNAEIVDGKTTDGRHIVDETINAESITGQTVSASEAILGSVLTQALTAGQITANEAMISSASIPMLYTTSISALGRQIDLSANELIQVLVGVAEDVREWFSFTENGLITRKRGSKWSTRTDADGYYIDHEDVAGHVGAFHREIMEVHGMQIGEIIARSTSGGGWVWTDE